MRLWRWTLWRDGDFHRIMTRDRIEASGLQCNHGNGIMGIGSEARQHILVVDDDARIRELLRDYLVSHGYRATAVADAAEAERCMGGMLFDLLIVDVMMPGESGLSLTARLCRNGRDASAAAPVPILMLTALAETEERIAGLEHGASDYLSKPFEPRELLLRVRNLLHPRIPATQPAAAAIQSVTFGALRFDMASLTLYRVATGEEAGGAPAMRIALTGSEEMLLCAFAGAPGHILSRLDIIAHCPGDWHSITEAAVDVRINRLRRKIEPDSRHPVYLQTVRGKGYVFRPDEIRHAA